MAWALGCFYHFSWRWQISGSTNFLSVSLSINPNCFLSNSNNNDLCFSYLPHTHTYILMYIYIYIYDFSLSSTFNVNKKTKLINAHLSVYRSDRLFEHNTMSVTKKWHFSYELRSTKKSFNSFDAPNRVF